MAKMEQDSAARIAEALHKLEAVAAKQKGTSRAVKMGIAKLHRVLGEEAAAHAEQLGIEVALLSGGLPKPPRPE